MLSYKAFWRPHISPNGFNFDEAANSPCILVSNVDQGLEHKRPGRFLLRSCSEEGFNGVIAGEKHSSGVGENHAIDDSVHFSSDNDLNFVGSLFASVENYEGVSCEFGREQPEFLSQFSSDGMSEVVVLELFEKDSLRVEANLSSEGYIPIIEEPMPDVVCHDEGISSDADPVKFWFCYVQ